MEHRYVINVIFQQPFFSQDIGYVQILNKSATFGYEKYKDVKKAYDEFNRKKFVERDTPAGKVSYNIISVELLDFDKYKEENKLIKEEDNDGNTREEQYASDEGHNGEDESQTE